MRTLTKVLLTAGLIAGGAALSPVSTPAQAQGVYFDAPGVHVGVGERHHRYYRRHYGEGSYAYDYAPRRWGGYRGYNGCRYGWTVQDGVCKPYRGY